MPVENLRDRCGDAELRFPGLYCFEGRHDAHGGGAVLYIGEAGHNDGSLRTIGQRANESLSKFSWDKTGRQLFSDVWDVTFRWAAINDATRPILLDAERLLLVAHAPPFNNESVRAQIAESLHNLLILNAGQKGRLLPTVAGAEYCSACWNDAR